MNIAELNLYSDRFGHILSTALVCVCVCCMFIRDS